jgi:2Fe-2S ferredoxin
MVAIRFVSRQADGSVTTRETDARPGQSLMQAAVAAGVGGIVAECGGVLVCATCHVHVAPEWSDRLPPLSGDEDQMLDCTAAPRTGTSRLSCQITVGPELDGLSVEVPARQY